MLSNIRLKILEVLYSFYGNFMRKNCLKLYWEFSLLHLNDCLTIFKANIPIWIDTFFSFPCKNSISLMFYFPALRLSVKVWPWTKATQRNFVAPSTPIHFQNLPFNGTCQTGLTVMTTIKLQPTSCKLFSNFTNHLLWHYRQKSSPNGNFSRHDHKALRWNWKLVSGMKGNACLDVRETGVFCN